MFLIAFCFVAAVSLSNAEPCRTIIPVSPWIRPDEFPVIYYREDKPQQIFKVECPTETVENITWYRGSVEISKEKVLKFVPLKSLHVGVYYCTATNGVGSSRSGDLEVKNALIDVPEPSEQHLILMQGEAVSIPCEGFVAIPKPNVIWSSVNGLLPNGFTVDPAGTLHIPRVMPEHSQTFTCSIKHFDDVFKIKTVSITVKERAEYCFEKPRLLYASEIVDASKNVDLKVFCVISSPEIKWRMPNEIHGALATKLGVELNIHPSAIADQDNQFTVGCDGGNITKDITIKLHKKPVILGISNVTITEGDSKMINCETSGLPAPKVEWFFNGEPITANAKRFGVQLHGSSEIYIRKATTLNSGVYRCEAVNTFGRAHQEIFVDVRKKQAHIATDAEAQCFSFIVGDRMQIPCELHGFNDPETTWYFNEEPQPPRGNDRDLVIPSAQETDDGIYKCEACDKNRKSCATYRFRVHVKASDFIKTPQKPVIVDQNEELRLACQPKFGTDEVRWFVNGKFWHSGQELVIPKPSNGTYSCELYHNNIQTASWDSTVRVRKIPPLIHISVQNFDCSKGLLYVTNLPFTDVTFFTIYQLDTESKWKVIGIAETPVFRSTSLNCSTCIFKAGATNEVAETMTAEFRCLNPERQVSTEKTYCDMSLRIKDVEHLTLGEVKIVWDYSSTCLADIVHLKINEAETFHSDIQKKEYRLQALEENKLYCVKLQAYANDVVVGNATETCFHSVEKFEWIAPDIETVTINQVTKVQTSPNRSIQYFTTADGWKQSDNSIEVSVPTKIQVVQRSQGVCQVSKVLPIHLESSTYYMIWILGVLLLVCGIFLILFSLLRKRSLVYEHSVADTSSNYGRSTHLHVSA